MAFLGGVNAAVISSGSTRASAAGLFACLTRLRVGGQLSGFANLVSVEITPFAAVSIPITAAEEAQDGSVLGQIPGLIGTELSSFPFRYSAGQTPVASARDAKAIPTPPHFDSLVAARKAEVVYGCLQVPLQRHSGQRLLVAKTSSCLLLFAHAKRAHTVEGYSFQIGVEVFLHLTGQLFERRQMLHLVWTGCLTSMCQPLGQPLDAPYPLTKFFNSFNRWFIHKKSNLQPRSDGWRCPAAAPL